MKREQVVDRIWDLMLQLEKNYSADVKNEAFRLALAYNSEHEDEIFMCEIYKEEGYENDGIMLEYDYILYSEDIR